MHTWTERERERECMFLTVCTSAAMSTYMSVELHEFTSALPYQHAY